MRRTSVAMTAATEEALVRLLVRDDGQEDLCLATYRTSTGRTRFSALIRAVVPPEARDRLVHGNATVTADYILRATEARRNTPRRTPEAAQDSRCRPGSNGSSYCGQVQYRGFGPVHL